MILNSEVNSETEQLEVVSFLPVFTSIESPPVQQSGKH
jgi:hypothetical protein